MDMPSSPDPPLKRNTIVLSEIYFILQRIHPMGSFAVVAIYRSTATTPPRIAPRYHTLMR